MTFVFLHVKVLIFSLHVRDLILFVMVCMFACKSFNPSPKWLTWNKAGETVIGSWWSNCCYNIQTSYISDQGNFTLFTVQCKWHSYTHIQYICTFWFVIVPVTGKCTHNKIPNIEKSIQCTNYIEFIHNIHTWQPTIRSTTNYTQCTLHSILNKPANKHENTYNMSLKRNTPSSTCLLHPQYNIIYHESIQLYDPNLQ